MNWIPWHNVLGGDASLSGVMLEFWRKKGSIAYRRVKQVKKGERKEERSDTAHPLQKASIDKMKEGKRNFETTFTQSLLVTLRSRRQLLLNCLKQHSNIISLNKQGQMIS